MELQVYYGTRYIDEVVGLRVKDQGRALDMRTTAHARCAGTARQGQVYLHQDERSEREPPATGKASGRERTHGVATCPQRRGPFGRLFFWMSWTKSKPDPLTPPPARADGQGNAKPARKPQASHEIKPVPFSVSHEAALGPLLSYRRYGPNDWHPHR
jgi:hypothetical protein